MISIVSALVEGLAWSALWIALLMLMFSRFPWLLVHDFPEDVRKAVRLPDRTPAQRRNGIVFTVFMYVIILGTLMAAGLVHYGAGPTPFGTLFLHLWIICMTWNVVDLLVLDWLVFCAITPKWFILPGTEGCKGYKDYKFHVVGFLKGCVFMTLFALIFAAVDLAILEYFIW